MLVGVNDIQARSAALIAGAVNAGPMSREIAPKMAAENQVSPPLSPPFDEGGGPSPKMTNEERDSLA